MVKFRKKTRRKLKRKSKQSIKGGRNRFRCYTKEQLDKIKMAAAAARPAGKGNAAAKGETEKIMEEAQKLIENSMEQGTREKRKGREERGAFSQQIPKEYLTEQPSPSKEPAIKRQMSSLSEDETEGIRKEGGSKKRKRRKKKKTRKARGIIDDLRKLCTTGRCGSPRSQTPTLRELALTIEQNILDDLNKNEPEIALTSEQRRNIKALANKQAAYIVNTSRSRRS